MTILLKRKIVAAILSSLLCGLIFSIPGGFELNLFLNLYYLYLMIVMTYGVIASFISDWLSKKLFSAASAREITSFVLHCFFGIVFLVFSLVAAIIFFIVDRLLVKVEIKRWTVIVGLLITVIVFIINIV